MISIVEYIISIIVYIIPELMLKGVCVDEGAGTIETFPVRDENLIKFLISMSGKGTTRKAE